MKALTSFGETDDLERLRSQYGKVAGALADVFHEAGQAVAGGNECPAF